MAESLKSHFLNWLKVNDDENRSVGTDVHQTTNSTDVPHPQTSNSTDVPLPQTTNSTDVQLPQKQQKSRTPSPTMTQSDIAFEDESLKLIVEKGIHKRQKQFRIQDHLFYFKIQQKKNSSKMPLLIDILDFLHGAVVHVLDSIKTFYKKGIIKIGRA